ncbi:unnamed protein product [Moneuplotes crassus]|uniref:SMP-LTD domain-containing protein n=1 Tax=Euplotes crassus TaxID=5936 RepID=A0AAD1XHJ2_EUPCR|nr:unnamed protein product [Moneuplotes crassus]
METAKDCTNRLGAQAALYIISTCILAYWMYLFIGIGFLVGVSFGITSLLIFELYIAYKIFNYEDYLKTSKDIEDNRLFWKNRLEGYQELIDKDISELANNRQTTEPKESFALDNDEPGHREDAQEFDSPVRTQSEKMKRKVIEKSLHELNDKSSDIMLTSGYAPLYRKESRRMMNRIIHKNDDKNFEVQFRSRLNKSQSYIRYFIELYSRVTEVEFQMNFKNIVDQKAKYSLTKKKTFHIFKKDSKWVQVRYLLKNLEHLHQENAMFIENAIKGQLEAFLSAKSDEFRTLQDNYDSLKKEKYSTLDRLDTLKLKYEESKTELEETLLKYEKAKSKGSSSYDKILEMEMKAKLAQKTLHDHNTSIVESKENIKELSGEMKNLKEIILTCLSTTCQDKLLTFTSTVHSMIGAYIDCFTEAVSIIEHVLFTDQQESGLVQAERPSIVVRSLSNVNNLFKFASPIRKGQNYDDLVQDDNFQTKASMTIKSEAFMNLLKTTISEINLVLDNVEEVDYVIQNCMSTFIDQSIRYEKLHSIKKAYYDEETKKSLESVNEIFIHLSHSFKKWELQYDLKKENYKIQEKIISISRKCDLESKLFKNELSCYSKIEAKNRKELTIEAFNTLQNKYEKFKSCFVEAIDTIKELKEVMNDKIDDVRYAFIDQIKSFYELEIEKLNQINPKPLEFQDPNEESKSLVQSLDIIEEEKQNSSPYKMEVNMGNLSDCVNDSEDDLTPKINDLRKYSGEKKFSQSVKDITRKIIDFNASNIEEISSTNFNDSMLEISMSNNRKKDSIDEDQSSMLKITNTSKERKGTTEIQILEVEEEEKQHKEETKKLVKIETDVGEISEPQNLPPQDVETAHWLNQLAKVVYYWYTDKKSDELNNILCKQLHKVYNDDEKPEFIGEIKVLDVAIGGSAPTFFSFQKLESDDHQFLGDVDLSFRGTVDITLSTEVHLNFRKTNYALIPITLKVRVQSVTGKLRIFLTQDFERMNWYSFVGQPQIKFSIDLILGKDNKLSFSIFPKIKKFIEEIFQKQLYKFVLPNKKRLEMPFFPDKKLLY